MTSVNPTQVSNLSAAQSETMWRTVYAEVQALAKAEPALKDYFERTVLRHSRFEDLFVSLLSAKLAGGALDARVAKELMAQAFDAEPDITAAAMADLQAVRDRDPAGKTYAIPLLFFKGYQALQCYRVGHWLWQQGRAASAWIVQNRVSEVFAVEIHPAARIGRGILLDHATGFVVGETAVIDDHVSILHEVTLGGTGKEHGDRHPKIRRGVLISAGAKILGNIVVGEGAKVGAGSVVLHDVPPHCTVAGVPARIVGQCEGGDPASSMDHHIDDTG